MRVGEGESLDGGQVGHEAGLLVLFDGSAAGRQPPALKIGPGAVDDAAYADGAKSEGFPLVLVFDVEAGELVFDLGGQAVGGGRVGEVVLLDEQGVDRAVRPRWAGAGTT